MTPETLRNAVTAALTKQITEPVGSEASRQHGASVHRDNYDERFFDPDSNKELETSDQHLLKSSALMERNMKWW